MLNKVEEMREGGIIQKGDFGVVGREREARIQEGMIGYVERGRQIKENKSP